MQHFQAREQHSMRLDHCSNMHNSGETVVAGLAAVYVVVGVNQFSADFAAK